MKPIYLSLLTLILLSSCKKQVEDVESVIATNNLEQIRQKKASLNTEKQNIQNNLDLLEAKIKELDPQEKIPNVSTFTVKEQLFEHYLELQGDVKTKENIVIMPEYSGVLNKIYVTEGQRVSKGQTLAIIDDGGLNQQLAQLQIQADLAKTTYERQERLWNQNIGSEIQYLQAKSNYKAQQKAITQLQQQLSKTKVKAPFSGTIDEVITEQGSVVAPGQSQLFRIVNLNNMYVETNVPERYLPTITKGKKVDVLFPITGKTISTKIRQSGNYINPANRTYKIEIAVPNKNKTIKPNLTAKLNINNYTNPKALLIPQSIISEDAQGQQYIYLIENKKDNTATAKRAFITTGKTNGDTIEVLTGLNNNDEIIKEGARSVKDNQEVNILNN